MLEFSSRLSRRYTYSKDTVFSAQENFTTEALAIATEDDPGFRSRLRELSEAKVIDALEIPSTTDSPELTASELPLDPVLS